VLLFDNLPLRHYIIRLDIFCGDENEDAMELDFSLSGIKTIKYAPIIFCDVERSFSNYKSMLILNRLGFKFESLKHYLPI